MRQQRLDERRGFAAGDEGGLQNARNEAAVEAAIQAWLVGDETEFARRRREVSNLLLHYEAPIYWRLVAVMHGLAHAGAFRERAHELNISRKSLFINGLKQCSPHLFQAD